MKYYVNSVIVTEVIKGDVNIGDEIYVKYPLEEVDKNYPLLKSYLKTNNECMLFLESYTDYDENIPHSLINPTQGCIKIAGDSVYSHEDMLKIFNFYDKLELINYLRENI